MGTIIVVDELAILPTEELVDKGYKLKKKYDDLEAELDAYKKELRSRAKKEKVDHFFGEKHFVNISPSTTTECDPYEVYKAYGDLGRGRDFYNAVKVLVGTAKKELGETLFGSIANIDTTPYKSVSFKANVPKKYKK